MFLRANGSLRLRLKLRFKFFVAYISIPMLEAIRRVSDPTASCRARVQRWWTENDKEKTFSFGFRSTIRNGRWTTVRAIEDRERESKTNRRRIYDIAFEQPRSLHLFVLSSASSMAGYNFTISSKNKGLLLRPLADNTGRG